MADALDALEYTTNKLIVFLVTWSIIAIFGQLAYPKTEVTTIMAVAAILGFVITIVAFKIRKYIYQNDDLYVRHRVQ